MSDRVIEQADLRTIEHNLGAIHNDLQTLDSNVGAVNSNIKVVYDEMGVWQRNFMILSVFSKEQTGLIRQKRDL